MNPRSQGVRLGWVIGLLLAILEVARAGFSRATWGMALLTLGLFPLLLAALCGVLASIPWFRDPARLVRATALLVVFPWILFQVFPHLSLAAATTQAGLVRLLLLLLVAIMAGAEASRRVRILARLFVGVRLAVAAAVLLSGAGGMLLVPRGSRPLALPHATGSGPNVLLITLDTVRRDALGAYSSRERRTPTLDSLAASGVCFTRAMSASPWTLASVSSIMTGQHPSTHGVFTGEHRLPEGCPTLAEALAAHGYHTRAVVTNAWLEPELGLAQGFALYDHRAPREPPPALYAFTLYRVQRRLFGRLPRVMPESADDVVQEALRFLATPSEPFFLWLHLNDAHGPYAPPPAYLPPDDGYRGPFRTTSGRVVRFRQGNRLSRESRERILRLYEGEVRYVDASLGRLFAGLRASGLHERTLVALMADHGEEFWEHGSVGHGHSLHDEVLGVPLMFSLPGTLPSGEVRDLPCSLVDVAPTIASVLGLTLPHAQGISLLDEPDRTRPLFAEGLEFFWEKKAVVKGGWKLILDPSFGTRQLFDMGADHTERYDVIRSHEEEATELEALLEESLRAFRHHADALRLDAQRARLSPEVRERLRAQGYLE